jgi:hypothetical protein
MTLPASGSINMNQVNVELGNAGTTAISLGQSTVRALAGIPSGAISLNSLHGKSSYKYGTPLGSRGGPGGTYVFLYIGGGQPYAPFYIYLINTTSGQPYPGYAAPYPGYLDADGNWSNSYNVATDPYWYPGPYTNYFNFYQGSTGPYPSGTFIGQVVLST